MRLRSVFCGMGNMLLITDLDNTLLRSDCSVSVHTAEVFKECRRRKILIGFASARAENAMTRFIDLIKPDVIISNGGATVRVDGKIIYQKLMSSETVHKIIEMCKGFTNQSGLITVEADDGYYCNYHPSDPDRKNNYLYTDFSHFSKPAYKVTPELANEQWAKQIVEACPECEYLNFSGEIWRRFAAKNVGKEKALSVLADYLHILPSDMVAFGDDHNDINMMQFVGTSVAVSNAIEEVKEIAGHITDSHDEDGVANYIEKYILNVAE